MEKENEKKLLLGIVFTILILVSLHNLTNASLWFDEAIEFYYSKILFGPLPYDSAIKSMYERIVGTFQPPLYNVLMFFWLKINESERWFRLFGVLMGFICALGVYKAVEKGHSYRAASVAVIILACTKQFIYYAQECAEYNLMFAGLGFFMYAWICVMEDVTPRRLFIFILTAVISVYSQYGAIFPVAAFSFIVFVHTIYKKDKNSIKNMIIGGAVATLGAALPLWFFFLRKQMENQQSRALHVFSIDKGILRDLFNAVDQVSNWLVGKSYNLGYILLLVFLIALIMSRKPLKKWLASANLLCWLLYYLAVRLSYYAYGKFNNRYCLFFIPVWVVSVCILIAEERNSSENICLRILKKNKALLYGVCLVLLAVFCGNGFKLINANWKKEDIRGATREWYKVKGYDKPTLVYYGANPGFSYYSEHDSRFRENTLDKVVFMRWYRGKKPEEYKKYLNTLFNNNWPVELHMIASHIYKKDVENIVKCFKDNGYQSKDRYNKNGAKLIYLESKQK